MAFLSDELRQQILAYLPRYPSKQAATLPALHLVHDALRYVPREAIKEIAELLDLSPAQVHDTMSFYQFFHEEDCPLGRTRLWVCRSLACALRGGDEVLAGTLVEGVYKSSNGGASWYQSMKGMNASRLTGLVFVGGSTSGRWAPTRLVRYLHMSLAT